MEAGLFIFIALWFLLVAVVVVKAAAILFTVGWLVARSNWRQRAIALGGLATVAASSLGIYAYREADAEPARLRRLNRIAALERVEVPTDHPRVLEVYGRIADWELAPLLASKEIDEVRIRQFPRKTYTHVYERNDGAGCGPEAASGGTGPEGENPVRDYVRRCLNRRFVREGFPPLDDAVVLYQRSAATAMKPDRQRARRAMELRLRRSGREALVDYAELQIIVRPRSPLLPLGDRIEWVGRRTLDPSAFILKSLRARS